MSCIGSGRLCALPWRWHKIDPARMKGMTFTDPFGGKPASSQHAMHFDRFQRIL